MTREEAIQYAQERFSKGLHRLEMGYLNRGLYQIVAREVDFLQVALAALRERDILLEQVRGYCHTCKKNKTDFDCHTKCYGHQRGSAWEWDGGRRLEEV